MVNDSKSKVYWELTTIPLSLPVFILEILVELFQIEHWYGSVVSLASSHLVLLFSTFTKVLFELFVFMPFTILQLGVFSTEECFFFIGYG